jgi:acetyltransferase-like isoleucine patch superfamily enzyme
MSPRDPLAAAGAGTDPGKLGRLLSSLLNPRSYLHALRLLHYYGYSHVAERPHLTLGAGSTIAPNVSLRNGRRITVGARTSIGERCYLWAGDSTGRIVIGSDVSLAPEVFVTASDYRFAPGRTHREQEKDERDVVIGDDVWLGARCVVTAGVTIGDGCVVGAGAVVTRSLPAGTIAAGVPAKALRSR